MTRLSHSLAVEFIESVLECPLDLNTNGRIEAFVLDKTVLEVSAEFEAFTAERGLQVDEDSVEFRADRIDICDDPCCQIIIKTDERLSLT
jgi:hypothetical protein